MQPDEAVAALHRLRQQRDGDRRGIRSHDRLVAAKEVGLREKVFLQLEILGDRFDDQIGPMHRRLEIGGVGKADPMFTKGAKTDPAAFRRYQRLDFTFVNANGKLRAARDIELGILGPLGFATRQHAFADGVH